MAYGHKFNGLASEKIGCKGRSAQRDQWFGRRPHNDYSLSILSNSVRLNRVLVPYYVVVAKSRYLRKLHISRGADCDRDRGWMSLAI